jgi:hypothetical protein
MCSALQYNQAPTPFQALRAEINGVFSGASRRIYGVAATPSDTGSLREQETQYQHQHQNQKRSRWLPLYQRQPSNCAYRQ